MKEQFRFVQAVCSFSGSRSLFAAKTFVGQSELAGMMRQHAWAKTSIGSPERWPESLKTAVRIMLTSRQPIWIGWGPELVFLYNDPYKSIIGSRHPWALGRPASEVWREIWGNIGPMLPQALDGREGTYAEAQLLIMERNGYPEETHHTFSYSPIFEADGRPGGVFCAHADDTQRVLGERQMILLRELVTATAKAQTQEQVCKRAAQALATNLRDLPFAMIYVMDADGKGASLAGRAGIDARHPAAAGWLSLDPSHHPWPLARVLRDRKASVVREISAAFEEPLPQGDWARPPRDAIVLPLVGGENGRGIFLICGLNPFRLLDDSYAGFLDLVAGQIASALANVEAHQRERRHAEALTNERSKELAAANASLVRVAAERERAEGHFRLLVEGVTDYAIFMLDPRGIVTNWNAGAERIKGYAASEIIGQHFSRFYTEEDCARRLPALALEVAISEGHFEAEGLRVRKDGSQFWANVVISPIRNEAGELLGFAKITRDITERHEAQQALLRTQEQLAQAQKMEGIGHLTGGVAHDFNNLLTIIIGNLESVQRVLPQAAASDRIARAVEQAMRGAQRAASLTQRLLAFSRRQPLDPKPVDTGALITGMFELLRRTLGEQIGIETVLAGGLWRVNVDPNQLEIGILNLAVNARDAMEGGGKLTIETANTYLDEACAASQVEVAPGQYVLIAVSDTGSGMSKEVLSRAFEPFYTTKDIGQGTGLGLSQVYGFVKQSGGNVRIYSEPGHGTSVKLYLPRLHSDNDEIVPSPPAAPRSASGQTVLVVEDEADVRAYSASVLRDLGYVVIEAQNGAAGLRALERHPGVAILFTDVGLPGGMNGRQLADAARTLRPDLKVLFTTGYERNAIVHGGRLDPGVVLLSKPFTYSALATRLHELLMEAGSAAN